MKKALCFFGFLILFNFSNAQTSYDQDIKKRIETRLGKYDKDSENAKHAYAILSHFDKAEKPELEIYRKKNVGVGVVLSDDDFGKDVSPIVVPSSYNYSDSKIGIAAVRDSKTKGTNTKLDAYVTTYIYDFENIFSDPTMDFLVRNQVPAYGHVTENNKEIVVEEETTLSFIRTDIEWMYIVSIDNDYKSLDVARIILYAYRLEFDGKDIFQNSKNPEKALAIKRKDEKAATKIENRLYHDHATNSLIDYVNFISEEEPYSKDSALQKYKNALPSVLDRDNVAAHLKTLLYFSDTFKLTAEHQKEYTDSYGAKRDLVNINHLSAHAIADIYMTQGNFKKAIEYFNKAQGAHPYLQSSGTTMNKDYLRIQYDLAEAYNKSNQNDLAIAHILNIMMNGQSSDDLVNKKLLEYSKDEDVDLLRKDIDAIAETIVPHKEYAYTYAYIFRDSQVTFKPFFGSAKKAYSSIPESEFYQELKAKAKRESKKTQMPPKSKKADLSAKDFYHGGELKNLEASLLLLMQTEQFKDDAKFKSQLASFQEKYKRKSTFDFIDELKYFYLYTYVTGDMIKNMTEKEGIGLRNIKHITGHLLSDYYMKSGKPNDALGYLLLLESNFVFERSGLEGENKDRQKVRSDLAETYLSIDTKEAALSYLLAIFLDGGYLADYADDKMATIVENLETEEYKIFKEQFFETLQMSDKTHYNFRMGYFYPKLELAKPMTLEALKKQILKSKLFKN